ncbi:MAG: alanine--tRNA ligase, partial [Candidatus Latescibacteria bacterium]|nr:alanine--tRNA ligase [Candidatus Latescibacterota bacterium]
TFFEMLGNFSFGDYFKKEAIEYAWEFMTEVLRLPDEKLWTSIYKDDDQAFQIWHEHIGVPAERIVRLGDIQQGDEENFWSMGDTGPCGPCSEILFDQGEQMSCGPNCGIGKCDCDRYLELWNLVFVQFERSPDGSLTPLPRPSIDTGLGLERIAAVMQKVPSNFETDLFRPLIAEVEKIVKRSYSSGPAGMPFRVIADHVRALTFVLADGALPSNEGRGYVLRRILRRASRYGRTLGMAKPFIYRLVGPVVDTMAKPYPELKEKREYVALVIKAEEERFEETLDQGLELFRKVVQTIQASGQKVIPGQEAFRLYDTYGFPLDLTVDMAEEIGLQVDLKGFQEEMKL